MASYAKRGKVWRVQIRKGGKSYNATFPLKVQAQEWAAQIEAEIVAGKLGKVPDKTFADLLTRYRDEVTQTKRGARAEGLRLARSMTDAIGLLKLSELTPDQVGRWRDRRLQVVGPASVNREWNTLSHACTVAVKEWRWLMENPFSAARRPPDPEPRQRVMTQAEVDAILHACGDDYTTAMGRVGLILLFALETAMRAGEICGMVWPNVHERHVHLPRTKNGSARDVPLSSAALAILAKLPRDAATVFDVPSATLDALFRKAKARALVSGVTFHDSRRTALTRLAQRFQNPLDLARISGHRDLRILSQVYYAPTIDSLADRLG